MDVDSQTKEAMEMVSQGAELTMSLINHVLRSASNRLNEKGNQELIKETDKDGKQKIDNLVKKHKNGIKSLDENLTKEQVKDYQKELKKLGVDFSVVKNEKDNYSFFFAGGQAEVIEKGLNNVVELKSRVMNNEDFKEAKLNVDDEMKNSSEQEIENAQSAFSKYMSRTEEVQIPEKENLNEKEKILFDKIKNLDEVEKEVKEDVRSEIKEEEIEPPTENQLKLASSLGIENTGNMNKKELSIALEKNGAEPSYFQDKNVSKKLLNDKISKLSDSDLKLFEKKMEYENEINSPAVDQNKSQELASELKELQSNYSKESISLINKIDEDFRDLDNSTENSKSNRLNANEILKETKQHTSNRYKDKSNEKKKENQKSYSMNHVKKLDKEIKQENKDKNIKKEIKKEKEHSL